MKKKAFSAIISLALCVVMALSLTACGGDAAPDSHMIKLSETELNLVVGEEQTLTYTVEPAGTSVEVEWSSSDTSVVTVDNNGKVTAVSGGHTSIVATTGFASAVCNVNVDEVWQAGLKNTLEQSNYTVVSSQNMTMSIELEDEDEPFVLGAIEIDQTHRFDGATLYSVQDCNANSMGEESSISNRTYIVEEDGVGNLYAAQSMDGGNYVWTEAEIYSGNGLTLKDYAAQTVFTDIIGYSETNGGNYVFFTDAVDSATFDKESNTVTFNDIKVFYSFNSLFNASFDATLAVTFKDGLVSAYTLSLTGNISFADMFGDIGQYSEEDASVPEFIDIAAEVGATITYGDTNVTVSADDAAVLARFKASRPLRDAYDKLQALSESYTMEFQIGGKTFASEKVYVNGKTVTVETAMNSGDEEYAVLKKGADGLYTADLYNYGGGTWYKQTVQAYAVSNLRSLAVLAQYFFDVEEPDENSMGISLGMAYYDFTPVDDDTFTATLVDVVWNGGSTVSAECVITIELDSAGRISSINLDYGDAEDGRNFMNRTYVFREYGTTQVTVPQTVIDDAVDVTPSGGDDWGDNGDIDSEVWNALQQLQNNTSSLTVNDTYTYNNGSGNDGTATTKYDTENFTMSVVDGGGTQYTKLVNEEGAAYCYNYYFDGNEWHCYRYMFADSYEEYLPYFASTGCHLLYCYALYDGGEMLDDRQLYPCFIENGGVYTADLYYMENVWDEQTETEHYQYTFCTVTVELDGEGRFASVKRELKEDGIVYETEELTYSYGNVTVEIPQDALATQPETLD